MGDRHGGCFARRGRTLNPPHPQVDAHRGVNFRWRAVGFRWRGAMGRICPTREGSPRRRPPDTAHERRDLPRAETRPSAKASRHGARAKEFAPRRNALLGEGLPTRRTSERICPAGFALAPRADERRAALGRRTAEKHPFGGVAPTACGRCRVHSPKKIRLLHETQLFYGESHVGSRQIFSSFPSVGRCVAREQNPVPPFAPHRGSEPRGLRRTGEMCHGFGEMVR